MLKYEFRHFQSKDNLGANVVYSADALGQVTVSNGIVPVTNWINMSEWILNADDLEIEYTIHEQKEESGEYDYGYNVSNDMIAIGEAAKFIKNWLIKHSAAHLNIIEVRITDLECNKVYPLAQITQKYLRDTCDGDCEVFFYIKQQDYTRDDLDKMVIYEGFENIYNSYPNTTIPTFEIMTRKQDDTGTAIISALIGIVPITTLATILVTLGVTLPSWADLREYIKRKLGVGRAIPAPKITTYIDNITSKINVASNTTFHNMLLGESVANPSYFNANKYSNICMAYMSGDDGLDNEDTGNNIGFWRNTYAPVWSARKFLNELSKHFNLRWRLYKDELVLRSVRWWDLVGNGAILYDFTTDIHKSKLAAEICYGYDSNKKLHDYIDGIYTEDSRENLGNEAIARYNDIVDYNRYADNRVLDGERNERSGFAPTSFYSDGIGEVDNEDWITNWYDNIALYAWLFIGLLAIVFFVIIAMNVAAIGGGFTAPIGIAGGVAIGVISLAFAASISAFLITINNDIRTYFNRGIIIDSKSWSNPKLLNWDTNTGYVRAEVKADYEINSTGTAMVTTPPVNLWNNPIAPPSVPPFHNHYPNYNNKGGNVQKHDTNNSTPKFVRNYLLMFEPDFENNIYADFWQYEDPNKHRAQLINFTVKIILCCEDAELLGLYKADNILGNQVSNVQLMKRIGIYKDDLGNTVYGRILRATVSHKENTITLKGNII